MEEDFKTIEHDFLHIKDHFNNCKFNYKERLSKYDFFQNIECVTIPETGTLLEESKNNLVEVKKVYKELDKEIKENSLEIYGYETKLRDGNRYVEELDIEEKEMARRFKELTELQSKLRINADLNSELDVIEIEINKVNQNIDKIKNELTHLNLESLKKEEEELKAIKHELAAKQKRLTIVNTESYIEDIYYWYEKLNFLFENIFGKINLEMVDNQLVFKMQNEKIYLEVFWKDNKIVDAKLYGSVKEEVFNRFNLLKDVCIEKNNILLIVETVFLK